MGKKRGFTLVELLVVIVIIGILAALLLPAIARAIRNAKITGCINNLTQLWKMENNYMVQFGGPQKSMPADTNSGFWLRMTSTTPPLIDATLSQIFNCPVYGAPGSFGTCQYSGPINNINTYADGSPVGADLMVNHSPTGVEGGNVVRKSGDCATYGQNDTMWSTRTTYLGPP